MASPSRSFNPNDIDRRERQRAQDLDSAMALCEYQNDSSSKEEEEGTSERLDLKGQTTFAAGDSRGR